MAEPTYFSSPHADSQRGWQVALPALHQTAPFRTRTWLSTSRSHEFDTLLCAIWERFAVAGLDVPVFTIRGKSTTQDPESVENLRTVLHRLEDKVELTKQIHLAILQLADQFYKVNLERITEEDLSGWGIKVSGHAFPDDFYLAIEVMEKLIHRKELVMDEDETFNFHAPLRQRFPYGAWPMPRHTDSGHEIEGYVLEDTEACYGEVVFTGHDEGTEKDTRYQRTVRVEWTSDYEPPCRWIFARCQGGHKILDAQPFTHLDWVEGGSDPEPPPPGAHGDGDWCPVLPTSTPPAPYPYHQPRTPLPIDYTDAAGKPRAYPPFVPPTNIESGWRIECFTFDKDPDAFYYLIDRKKFTPGVAAKDLAYRAKVNLIALNGYVLPQYPLIPWDVTDFLVDGENELRLRFDNNYSWSDIYLIETIHTDTDIPAPAVPRYHGKCYEALGTPEASGYYYYYYYYEDDNRKCWVNEYLTEHVKFKVYGAINPGFLCYGRDTTGDGQEEWAMDVRTKAAYHDQLFKVSFAAEAGLDYELRYHYKSVTDVFRDYKVWEGVTTSEITEVTMRVPTDVHSTLRVMVKFPGTDHEDTFLHVRLGEWGFRRGQVWDPLPPCPEHPPGEVFTTQFDEGDDIPIGFFNNPPQPSKGQTEPD